MPGVVGEKLLEKIIVVSCPETKVLIDALFVTIAAPKVGKIEDVNYQIYLKMMNQLLLMELRGPI